MGQAGAGVATESLGRTEGKGSLEHQGYTRFYLAEQMPELDWATRLAELGREFADLPQDPYAHGLHRYRRYSRAATFPWTEHLEWIPERRDERGVPIAEYFQGDYNPDFASTYRRFPALSPTAKSNPLLERMIRFDFGQTFWSPRDRSLPIHVGVHLVKLMCQRQKEEAVSSPDHLHQDGEPFTFAHLITRHNVLGGLNTIASPDCAGVSPEHIAPEFILAQFELTRPLESYGVCDRMVSHHVSRVRCGSSTEPAERGVVLIDFTPMTPRV